VNTLSIDVSSLTTKLSTSEAEKLSISKVLKEKEENLFDSEALTKKLKDELTQAKQKLEENVFIDVSSFPFFFHFPFLFCSRYW